MNFCSGSAAPDLLDHSLLPSSFLSQHFQSVLQTLEEQVAGERQRLVETHLARVEAILNNNRRLALENYLTAVQSDLPQVSPSQAEKQHKLKIHLCNKQIYNVIVCVCGINIVPLSH